MVAEIKFTVREEAIARGLAIAPPMLDAEQLGWLYDLARSAPVGVGCEIGVFRGSSLITWMLARPGQQAIAIDDFQKHGAQSDIHERSKELLRATLDQHGFAPDQILIFEARSYDAAMLIPDDSLAFLFIDADHTEPGIGRDITVWPQKVLPGGIIVFHDYGSWKPHYFVTQAVDTWHQETQWEKLGKVGSAIAFKRPE